MSLSPGIGPGILVEGIWHVGERLFSVFFLTGVFVCLHASSTLVLVCSLSSAVFLLLFQSYKIPLFSCLLLPSLSSFLLSSPSALSFVLLLSSPLLLFKDRVSCSLGWL